MASIFQVEARRPSARRAALVAFLLSPTPATMLKIIVAISAAWTLVVAWAAISLVGLITS